MCAGSGEDLPGPKAFERVRMDKPFLPAHNARPPSQRLRSTLVQTAPDVVGSRCTVLQPDRRGCESLPRRKRLSRVWRDPKRRNLQPDRRRKRSGAGLKSDRRPEKVERQIEELGLV